jgi:hypothetical protein
MLCSASARRFVTLALALAASATPACRAQEVQVPRPATGDTSSFKSEYRAFDPTHLKDRPYTFDMPKPSYPSTERVQREFVVEYLYDYAFSEYTPVVKLPVAAPGKYERDTPEHALLALFSAMRSGDYDNWVKGWDETGQKQLEADAKNLKQDAAFWRKLWAQTFAKAKDFELTDRVETASQYVILDVRLTGTNLTHVPTVLKRVGNDWVATNDLTTNPILYQFRPELAGIVNIVPPVDAARLDHENRKELDSQQQFLDDHTQRSRTVQAGR